MKLIFQSEEFPQFYQRLKSPVLRYVQRAVRDGEVAEELTQEVFLKAYRARDTYENDRSATTWLWAITRNTVRDWHRKRAIEPRRAQESFATTDEHEALCESLPSLDPDAESLLSHGSERRELRRKLKGLTRLQRRVLWYRVVRELSYEEISRRLGLSISASKCAFYRARLALSTRPAFA